jgi:hypothetical protein
MADGERPMKTGRATPNSCSYEPECLAQHKRDEKTAKDEDIHHYGLDYHDLIGCQFSKKSTFDIAEIFGGK